MQPTDTPLQSAVLEGLDAAENPDDLAKRRKAQAERQQVSAWLTELKGARDFDQEIRKAYARDRRYARGDSGFEVSVPLIAGAIDTIVSFVYAKDPDVDCRPSRMVEKPKEPMPNPPVEPPPPAGLQGLMANPEGALMQGGGDLQQAAFQAGAQLAQEQAEHAAALEQHAQAMAEYTARVQALQADDAARRQRKTELALFAQTLEIVVSKLWKKAKLKRRARRTVRSSLSTSIGWVKVSWQERTQRDPVIQQQINDLKDTLARIARQKEELAEGQLSGDQADALRLSIEQQIAGLSENVERVVARGMVIDFVASENLQVAPGVEIMEYLDAPWINERVYMTIGDAAVKWPDVDLKKLRKATRYNRRKPKADHEAPEVGVGDDEVDQYVIGQQEGTLSDDDYIAIEEKWSQDDGLIYRTAQGLDFWLDEPTPPNVKSSRFYGYFALAFFEVDGERSPQSLPKRTWRLENEYNRTRSAFAEMRRRSYPGVIFDEGELEPGATEKLTKNARQEFIGLKTVSGKPIGDAFTPKPVSSIDGAMYDTTPVIRDFDRTSGTQEALQGSIEAGKTATEAEIQNTGFQTRSGSMRDALEDWLSEIAQYSATLACQKLDRGDVMVMAGGDAVWPELDTPEELETLIEVDIRAGSSGKPNTRGDREAWQVALPLVQAAAMQIGQLRGSNPSEVADKLEAITETTLTRLDERGDISRYIPQSEGMTAPGGAPAQPGAPGAGAPAQPQVPGMTPAPMEQ